MATINECPYAKGLKVGDVVCTVSYNRLNFGIFAGFGAGTFQIYQPESVLIWKMRKDQFDTKASRPWVLYTKAYEENIVKVDVNGLIDEKKKQIEEAKQILIEHKFVKNYEQ
jgi:hypothetical protein